MRCDFRMVHLDNVREGSAQLFFGRKGFPDSPEASAEWVPRRSPSYSSGADKMMPKYNQVQDVEVPPSKVCHSKSMVLTSDILLTPKLRPRPTQETCLK